jgi:hypothetical protein
VGPVWVGKFKRATNGKAVFQPKAGGKIEREREREIYPFFLQANGITFLEKPP